MEVQAARLQARTSNIAALLFGWSTRFWQNVCDKSGLHRPSGLAVGERQGCQDSASVAPLGKVSMNPPLPRDAFPRRIATARLRLRMPEESEAALYARQSHEAYATQPKPLSR